ncbi:hypothetical protein [Mucilaginibacter terrae]|uniref:Outer membrane lipoprotein-sorting protein n=1 Tax=Mucilaginibacter terrae TaxID=1955052 RepID=A0ABU3GQ97_9SPHI|nr:hypothetical protein [Mucilaginibacter terrae]MDT3401800.1 outer membrane lipoprotein-sorting protein [Mucilaginibacter terrae]
MKKIALLLLSAFFSLSCFAKKPTASDSLKTLQKRFDVLEYELNAHRNLYVSANASVANQLASSSAITSAASNSMTVSTIVISIIATIASIVVGFIGNRAARANRQANEALTNITLIRGTINQAEIDVNNALADVRKIQEDINSSISDVYKRLQEEELKYLLEFIKKNPAEIPNVGERLKTIFINESYYPALLDIYKNNPHSVILHILVSKFPTQVSKEVFILNKLRASYNSISLPPDQLKALVDSFLKNLDPDKFAIDIPIYGWLMVSAANYNYAIESTELILNALRNTLNHPNKALFNAAMDDPMCPYKEIGMVNGPHPNEYFHV